MTRRPWPAQLRVGAGLLAVMSAACLLGPSLISGPPRPDPVGGALVPPGTLLEMVTLTDGRVVSGESLTATAESVLILRADGEDLEVPAAQVTGIAAHRFWLGSDRFGRDVLARLLEGGRTSLTIAAASLAVALLLGAGIGLAAATGGRLLDAVLMRTVDAMMAFPMVFLLILMAALFRPGAALLVLVLAAASWMGVARLVRGQALALRRRGFVLASVVAGTSWHRRWRIHYLPNLAGPLAQDAALRMGDLILAEATLSFLGLGVPPPTPTWGGMVAEGHQVLVDGWWLAAFPGLAIAAVVIALATFGDGLQELLTDG